MDESIGQTDVGMRNTDFFDDTSDDDSSKIRTAHHGTTDRTLADQRGTSNQKDRLDLPGETLASEWVEKAREPLVGDETGYEPLTPSIPPGGGVNIRSSNSSLVGSVDELLPVWNSSPPSLQPPAPDSGKAGLSQAAPDTQRSTDRSTKRDKMLDKYAIAHDITLQALMRDEEVLEERLSPSPPAQVHANDRRSILHRSFRDASDVRSPRTRHVSSPPVDGKKAHIILPPIDTSGTRRSLPAAFIRTPFPRSAEPVENNNFSKDGLPTSASNITSTTESVLSLSVKQSNPSSRRRVTSLVIPASNDFSAIRSSSPRAKEQHFRALDFDDAAFFRRLRKCYRELMGPWQLFSARSLRRIVVNGSAMTQADRGYWVNPPRSPRWPASSGLKDTFTQERILQHYRNPDLGRSRYAFVHWAHLLAAASPTRTANAAATSDVHENGEALHGDEKPEGLEFVVSWSALRISLAFIAVLVVVMAATLLWIFLGSSTAPGVPSHGGYRHAGDRITAGVVMGICLLLIGLSGIAGWLGVSWLAM